MQQSGAKGSSFNRRKHSRFPASRQLILSEIDESGKQKSGKAEYAYARNLSAGGMQIQTKCPLFLGTLLNFTYSSAETSNHNDGLAEVAWCHYQEDSLTYLAGLSFQ
ncbi:MAG: PilZ domain-containing protein [Desulfopila sp.]